MSGISPIAHSMESATRYVRLDPPQHVTARMMQQFAAGEPVDGGTDMPKPTTPLAAAPKQAEQQGVERLANAAENLAIAIGMGWDLDGVIDEMRAALPTAPVTTKAMRADDVKAVVRAWLDADDATHWGAFEVALDAAVEGVSERDAVVAMLQADAETMRQNAAAYSEEAPTDARALHEVAATLAFKAAQIKRGDHLAALNAPTGTVEKERGA